MLLIQMFQEVFQKANLTEKEIKYFMDDALEGVEKLGYKSPTDYYKSKETQFCIVNYAVEEWKDIAESGLKKILSVIQ